MHDKIPAIPAINNGKQTDLQQLPLSLAQNKLCIRRSQRAKRLRVSINLIGEIEVTVPHRATAADVQRFLRTQDNWITRRKSQIDSLRSPQLNNFLPADIYLPATGEHWQVIYHEGSPNLKNRINDVTGANFLSLAIESNQDAGELLKIWLSRQAKRVLLPWLRRVSDETGLRYAGAGIRGQRTRWASCSSRKYISLNRCMLFLDPEQIRYLLVHELCHTRHMNHAAEFWDLVNQFVPNYRNFERTVNQCCYQLPAWAF